MAPWIDFAKRGKEFLRWIDRKTALRNQAARSERSRCWLCIPVCLFCPKTRTLTVKYAELARKAEHRRVASVHRMNYLVTWNFKHIANPFIRSRLRKTVFEAGFHLPVLCSPDELLQHNEDS